MTGRIVGKSNAPSSVFTDRDRSTCTFTVLVRLARAEGNDAKATGWMELEGNERGFDVIFPVVFSWSMFL
jgi:hypothetical protein